MAKILRIELDYDGFKNEYITKLPNSQHTFTVVNHRLVHVNQLAKVIWSDKRFLKAIESKSERAHEAGELPRLPPFAAAIYVDIDELKARLTSWCHRDEVAKRELAAFDFDALHEHLRTTRLARLRRALIAHDEQTAYKRQRICAEIDRCNEQP